MNLFSPMNFADASRFGWIAVAFKLFFLTNTEFYVIPFNASCFYKMRSTETYGADCMSGVKDAHSFLYKNSFHKNHKTLLRILPRLKQFNFKSNIFLLGFQFPVFSNGEIDMVKMCIV